MQPIPLFIAADIIARAHGQILSEASLRLSEFYANLTCGSFASHLDFKALLVLMTPRSLYLF